jgi:hypothetical protein
MKNCDNSSIDMNAKLPSSEMLQSITTQVVHKIPRTWHQTIKFRSRDQDELADLHVWLSSEEPSMLTTINWLSEF